MGVLPLEFPQGVSHETLGLTGSELFSLSGIEGQLHPGQEVHLEITRNGKVEKVSLKARLDTPIEIDYYLNGGILPYVLRNIIAHKKKHNK